MVEEVNRTKIKVFREVRGEFDGIALKRQGGLTQVGRGSAGAAQNGGSSASGLY